MIKFEPFPELADILEQYETFDGYWHKYKPEGAV